MYREKFCSGPACVILSVWMYTRSKLRSVLIVIVLAFSGFCLTTATGLIAALLVELSREFSVTVAGAGQLLTFTAVTWGLLAPLAGPISDRLGRRLMLTAGLLITGIALLGFSFGPNLPVLIGLSLLLGMGEGLVGPNHISAVGDYFSPRITGRAMAFSQGGMPLASLIGVPFGAFLAGSLGWRTSFLVLGFFTLAVTVLCFIILPPADRRLSGPKTGYFSSFYQALKYKQFVPLLIANTLLQAAFWAVNTYVVAFLIQSYALSTSRISVLLPVMGVGQFAGLLLGSQLADRFNKTKLCGFFQVLSGLTGVTLMLYLGGLWFSLIIATIFISYYGITRPTFLSLAVHMSGPLRGTFIGIQASSVQLGRGLGAFAGFLITFGGYGSLGVLCLVLSLASAFLFLINTVQSDSR